MSRRCGSLEALDTNPLHYFLAGFRSPNQLLLTRNLAPSKSRGTMTDTESEFECMRYLAEVVSVLNSDTATPR